MSAITEAEAKTKWCPFARVVVDAPEYASGNRFEGDTRGAEHLQAQSLCLASGCMAWRAEVRMVRKSDGKILEPGMTFVKGSAELRPTDRGYCGLAGKP